MAALKKGREVLVGPIVYLVNISLSGGKFPRQLKQGKVIPVHKGKNKSHSDPASYRPITILPVLSKVIESIVKQDIDAHLSKVGYLPNSQYGFCQGRSTTQAVGTAHTHWLKAKPHGKAVCIMAFDLASAFNTPDPDVILDPLGKAGISGGAGRWFKSYLSDGLQRVAWGGATSGVSQVKYGVRQGSILGPLVFLTLMAGLPTHLGVS